jgi:hypothetical protein
MVHQDDLHSALTEKKITAEAIVRNVIRGDQSLTPVFRGISSKEPRVKYGCSKSLLLLSEKNPELLYSKWDVFVEILKNENQILKWMAIAILGNLAAVDRKHQHKGLLRELHGFLSCGELITANNAIVALGKIARACRDERREITAQLLKVEHYFYDTDECRNIALGKVILALGMFIDPANASPEVIEFVRRQTTNSRSATAKKAATLLKKLIARGGSKSN